MKTLISIKADTETKKRAQKAAYELGLPLSAIVNAYLKEFVRSREVTFSMEPRLRSEVIKLLERASKDYRAKKNTIGPFSWAKEMDIYLDS